MKKVFFILTCLSVFVAYNVWGDIEIQTKSAHATKEKNEEQLSYCPKFKIYGKLDDCLKCHTIPNFKIKEAAIDEAYDLPYGSKIINKNGKSIITYKIDNIGAGAFEEFFNYLTWHPERKYIRLEIDSYGGSMWGMKSIIGFMDEFKASGGIIETVVRGKAFSAGFAIFLNGTKNHRYIARTAHLMWHQVLIGKLFTVETPASSEDEAAIYRHWQDTMNEWIASKSKLTKEQVDELVHKKELWCNGKEAVEKYGFADKLIK